MDPLNAVIDLSHFNTNGGHGLDFEAAKADGIVGVIHKATQGLGYTDPTYAERKAAATAAGLLWGAYHFGTGGDPVAQAKHFVGTVNPGPHDLLVLDLEANTTPGEASMSLLDAQHFITYVHVETGRWPGVYSNTYVRDLLGGDFDHVLSNCWFWSARYGPAPDVPITCWGDWTMWQYTDGQHGDGPHTVAGIGPCDRDKFNGTLAQLRELWGYPTG